MTEIADAVSPKIFITTGTAGAIGADVMLGDVVVGGKVRFDCTSQFQNEPWHNSSVTPSPLPPKALDAISPALLQLNASRVPNSRSTPKIWHAATDAIVTTDRFAFDDSTDYYKLQGLGRVCEMGDAMVASALQGIPGLSWHAIRNASDPQIPNASRNIEQADQQAAQIYAKYGGLTTTASVIAAWAVIHAAATLKPAVATPRERTWLQTWANPAGAGLVAETIHVKPNSLPRRTTDGHQNRHIQAGPARPFP